MTNVSNIIFYKDELNRTLERMQNINQVDENLLKELQMKVYILMKQKYYPGFKQSSEFQKLLTRNELSKSLSLSIFDDNPENGFDMDAGKTSRLLF